MSITPTPSVAALSKVREHPLPGPVPRYEIPGWRERFGLVAGITARGEGEEPFDLGLGSGQPVGSVMRRWRELRGAEPGFAAFMLGHQVHQTRVPWVEAGGPGWTLVEGTDGHATDRAGLMLLVTVADCIPVYLFDPDTRAMALLHAGWRGTAGGILRAGLETLSHRRSIEPTSIIMHCGVGICGDCYEVGSEVMAGLGLPSTSPPCHVDLRAVLADQARAMGIRSITASEWCSAHDRDRFFSHRASRGLDGRMVAYLGAPT